MSAPLLIILCISIAAWILLIVVARILERAPRAEIEWGLVWMLVCIYGRVVHRVRYEGIENIPTWKRTDPPVGPLVIVSNHSAGVDPLLIHGACPFDIRWMMMRRMMVRPFARLWAWAAIIPVEQGGRDSAALRTAIRHLQAGNVVGIFAEGGLEQPPGHINPYLPGVGMLVLKSGARVLPVVICGTPRVDRAYLSLLLPSHAHVRFLPIREYAPAGLDALGIARDLELAAANALGWPRCDRAQNPEHDRNA